MCLRRVGRQGPRHLLWGERFKIGVLGVRGYLAGSTFGGPFGARFLRFAFNRYFFKDQSFWRVIEFS